MNQSEKDLDLAHVIWNNKWERTESALVDFIENYTVMSHKHVSTLLTLCKGNPQTTGGFTPPVHGIRSFDVTLLLTWTSYWTNNRVTSDLNRHEAHVTSFWRQRSIYRKTPSISRTKSQNLNVSCLIMQLSLLNQLKPGVQSRMKM